MNPSLAERNLPEERQGRLPLQKLASATVCLLTETTAADPTLVYPLPIRPILVHPILVHSILVHSPPNSSHPGTPHARAPLPDSPPPGSSHPGAPHPCQDKARACSTGFPQKDGMGLVGAWSV